MNCNDNDVGLLLADQDAAIAKFSYLLAMGEGFHDIGLWVEFCGCALCKKRFGGLAMEVRMPGIADPARILTAPQAAHSVRTEMQYERNGTALETWISRGRLNAAPHYRLWTIKRRRK